MSLTRVRELAAMAALNVAVLGAALASIRDPRPGAVAVLPAPSATPAPTATPARLHVYVSGAVARPDVVRLAEGARAKDAIGAAGGFAAQADRAGINLAAPLADGQQLHVPAQGEGPPVAVGLSAPPVAAAALGGAGGGAIASASSADPIVDINRASAAELEALPGVGPALAARILAYRESNGPFASADDLDAVSGIGERTLERLRPFVAVR